MTEREEEGPKRLITDDSCYTNKKLCIDMEEMNGIVNRSEDNSSDNILKTSIDNCEDDSCYTNKKLCIDLEEMNGKVNRSEDNSSDNTSKTSIDNCEEKPELFNGVEISKLTKRQQKKYNKMLKWQEVKKEKRAKERLKLKEKKVHAKLNNIDLGPSRKELKRMKMANSPCKISICLDLSFDDLMIDKDMAKTIKQILRVYTENRRAKEPMQLHLTSFNGRSKNEMSKHHGYENWDINFHCEDYMNVFPKDKLVYLTSESDNIINKLESDKVYIIGGLVDHNFHKGLCYKKALEQGIAHGQLPISEYFWMKHRKVFTINQVFEILLRVSEGRSFKEAFEMILPKRINMQPSTKNNSELEESEVPSESS